MNVKISHCKVTLFLISNKNNLNFVIPLRNLYDIESPPKKALDTHPFHVSCNFFMQFPKLCISTPCTASDFHFQNKSYFTFTKKYFTLLFNNIQS